MSDYCCNCCGCYDYCCCFSASPYTMFSDSSMSTDPFRVLVVGERGVGKTQWIQSFRDSIMDKVEGDGGNGEAEYISTREPTTTYIPYPEMDCLTNTCILEEIYDSQFSHTCKHFILNPERRKETTTCHPNILHHSVNKYLEHYDIVICEYPANQISYPFDRQSNLGVEIRSWRKQYDCVVIMGDYSDITSLRSIYHWCLVCGFSPTRTIICINKCDIEPECLQDDFQSRKARVINHFVEQCPVEYISAKTGTNVQFLYKYMHYHDFRSAMKTPHIQKN